MLQRDSIGTSLISAPWRGSNAELEVKVFLAVQEEGWAVHAYHINKILPGLKDRQQREKQAETEKFNSIKRNVLRCWAWSQNQSILQHRSPAYLETARKVIISTKAVTGKRTNFFLKKLCLQGTEQHWCKKPKLQVT